MAFDVVLEWRGEEVAAEFVDVALDAIEAAAKRSRAAILEAWRSSMPVLTGRMKASAQLDIERTRETVRLHFRVVTYYFYHRRSARLDAQARQLAIAIVARHLPGQLA